MEEYRKMLDMFDDGEEQMKLQCFTGKLLNRDATYTSYQESFYRILNGLTKEGINVYVMRDEVTGCSIEDCLYLMCRDHEAIGLANGLSLGNFIAPANKETRAALRALLEQLIESGIIQYGPAEMFTHALETNPTSSSST